MADKLAIWNAVSETNPAHTKHVNQRGGFTAISAQYQILAATAQFGPVGIGWGYTSGDPVIVDTLIIVPVTLWHGSRENTFGPMMGCEEWKDKNGRVDSDAPKKATTDALTKLLSHLGFNADVFLGRFDDNKYVEQMKQKFAAASEPDPMSPIPDKTRDWLQSQIDAALVPVGDVCRAFEVSSLKQLTFGQVREVTDWLKQKKAA